MNVVGVSFAESVGPADELRIPQSGRVAFLRPSGINTSDGESSLGWVVPPSDQQSLFGHKARIVELLREGDAILFAIVEEVKAIEAGGLFRYELNPATSSPFSNMTEYMPYLVQELKTEANLHKFSERTLREYLRLDKIFVQGLGIPASTILEDGASIYSEAAEALSYNHRTGVIDQEPRAGKLSSDDVMRVIEQAKEGGWRVQDVRESLDEQRDVKRRSVGFSWGVAEWRGYREASTFKLKELRVFEDGTLLASMSSASPVSYEMAEWLSRKMGAVSTFDSPPY